MTEYSLEYLDQEIQKTQRAIEEHERAALILENSESEEPVVSRLVKLDKLTDDLLLTEDIVKWTKQDTENSEEILSDAESCEELGKILCRHEPQSNLYKKVYKEEFLPLFDYVNAKLIASLRGALQHAKYPSSKSCRKLLDESDKKASSHESNGFFTIASCCEWISRLKNVREKVLRYVDGYVPEESDAILLELCRPFVERIRYHFVEASTDRPTSSRIDRLPEWLFLYIRENILEGGPWDLILNGLTSHVSPYLPIDFLNEIIRIIQWVFGERQFFSHSRVAGPQSEPLILCNAVEQFLQFDYLLQGLVPAGQSSRLLALMDIFVAGDDELLEWWLDREKESAFSILLKDDVGLKLPILISPRAEIFCSLIRSIKSKAAVFSFSGPYLRHVAAPLCMNYLDMIRDLSTGLRKTLTRRKHLSDDGLRTNIMDWAELINGAHISVTALTENDIDNSDRNIADDFVKFGSSLQKLEESLIDEFSMLFVDVLLMERAKFAGYLMRCSHLLSSSSVDIPSPGDISPDLKECQMCLTILFRVCEEHTVKVQSNTDLSSGHDMQIFALGQMRERVLVLVAEKLIEVAIDIAGATPDIYRKGCAVFVEDLKLLFGNEILPPLALRLIDIGTVMNMEGSELVQLGNALCSLVESSPPLSADLFAVDDRLYDEAMSMINAKGLVWIELEDMLSVLNRRRDLAQVTID